MASSGVPGGKVEDVTNILFVGVGGQGIVLASEVLCGVAFKAGLDVKKSDIYGMAQRGGSVISHIRFGPRVFSPMVEKGKADITVSFEEMEVLRWIALPKEGGTILLNQRRIPPPSVAMGKEKYPERIPETLQGMGFRVLLFNAWEKALSLGNPRIENMVIMGFLSRFLQFDSLLWEEEIRSSVPEKYLASNLSAFAAGREMAPL